MGGDGTVHEVVNGLAYGTLLRRGRGQMPPLAIVPCGSGNTVAFTLGLATAEDALGTRSSAMLAVHYSLFPCIQLQFSLASFAQWTLSSSPIQTTRTRLV